MVGRTIIPFRLRHVSNGSRSYVSQPRPLRPRYRPFHQPLTRARRREYDDERDIWQMLSPDVAEFLRAKMELARELRRQTVVVMSDS